MGKSGGTDGIDAWVTSVLTSGFGGGGEAAELEVLSRVAQVHFKAFLHWFLSERLVLRESSLCWGGLHVKYRPPI